MIIDTTEIANIFNKFCIQIVENKKYISLHKALQVLENSNMDESIEMELIPSTEKEVINAITSLKILYTSEYGVISNQILKHYVNLISKHFTYVCNSLPTSRIYPYRCKYAFVQPI